MFILRQINDMIMSKDGQKLYVKIQYLAMTNHLSYIGVDRSFLRLIERAVQYLRGLFYLMR